MMRTVLRVLGAIALILFLLAAAAVGEVEWKAHAAIDAPAVAVSAPTPGRADAPVLILLHGAGLNGHMWDPVRRTLDPAYRVIALDLPGHGANRDGTYSLAASTATIAAAARSVAPAPVVLVGDSLGGYSAMAAAAALPREQLKGLVLGGSSGNFELDGLPSYVGGILLVRVLGLISDDDRLAMRALGHFPLSEPDKKALLDAGMNLRAVSPAARSLMGVDFRAKLAALDVPVLVVNGSLDKRAMAKEADFVAGAKQVTRLTFENCEHGVSLRRPAEFAAAVNAFAARVVPVTR